MKGKIYNVIGVMSGTSLDGVDCAYAKIVKTKTYSAEILLAETIPYPANWQKKLAQAHNLPKAERDALNVQYTAYLGEIINNFIDQNNLRDIDAICSHGHTVLHQPDKGFTLQIGNLPKISMITGHKVVCDFREQDVRLGGQGAPLVPIGDSILFSEYDYCLNLGGFANVSTEQDGKRIAYDICPVNVVLNRYAKELGADYDKGGAFAKAGNIHTPLFEKLNALPYYEAPAPKSLGIEWVHQHIFPIIEPFQLSANDVLATFTEHVAFQLAQNFGNGGKVLVTGGGAFNEYLVERVKKLHDSEIRFREPVSPAGRSVQIIVPENKLVEFKEALVFALLGVLKMEGDDNCLASVTGAKKDHSSGKIYVPDLNIK
ncbi:anhydro-N-acetylmuramic acid kinase [Dokdonia sinensis]|uniref:Anhydro-N-acetylmuramic acid kinase n=1 Tax=Dokdonia sinensis TaxID=2479847 RepID=A0A3M0FWK6_9FLAO|nr:anhydro-N-acetylmuramic acid kinase [Dokdonia sinensis]RMB57150.1 anhydro-N-acetylmuramic acid kinase [Dokdonia sinensis]